MSLPQGVGARPDADSDAIRSISAQAPPPLDRGGEGGRSESGSNKDEGGRWLNFERGNTSTRSD